MVDTSAPIERRDQLIEGFLSAEKPKSVWGVGVETEKFGVAATTGDALAYSHTTGPEVTNQAAAHAPVIADVFAWLKQQGWTEEAEYPGGPVIALRRGGAAITLEPGAQFELSGDILSDAHAVRSELEQHLAELAPISKKLGISWLSVGFHPLAAQAELGWVPKQRYAIMREYLPPLGYAAHDMMRRTGTTQSNFDYSSERDAMTKLRVALALAPLVHAMTANAPFRERRPSGYKSLRGDVWLHMDPTRSGLIPALWQKPNGGYADYVEWALDAGMFLFKRAGKVVANTGQTFRDFLSNGFQGERATQADWQLHLNTLFPEVRLKNTLEFRACDALPVNLAVASVALMLGILYDEQALAQSLELIEPWRYQEVQAQRPSWVRDGLAGSLAGVPAREHAERLLEIAAGGLQRRARRDRSGNDEATLLAPLTALVTQGRAPADLLLADPPASQDWTQTILERARVL